MEDFEILEHLILPDNTDVCNFVIHSFTTNRNCKKYVLDGVQTLIDTSNFQIRYPRGQEFKIELFDTENSGTNLQLGTYLVTGGPPVYPNFMIFGGTAQQNVVARFTLVSITGSCQVKNRDTGNLMNIGDSFDLTIQLNFGDWVGNQSYGWRAQVFGYSPVSTEPVVTTSIEILSAEVDVLPSPVSIQKNKTIYFEHNF